MVCAQSVILAKLLSVATVLSLILFITHTPTETDAVPLFTDQDRIRRDNYCAEKLDEVIIAVCGGRVQTLAGRYPGSFGSFSGSRSRSRSLKRLVPDSDVFYSPLRTGPIHECCRNPCTLSDLREYCADPDD